jgi:hypothetical protein
MAPGEWSLTCGYLTRTLLWNTKVSAGKNGEDRWGKGEEEFFIIL